MFKLKPSKIEGCFELQHNVFEDSRGQFLKLFNKDAFAAHNLDTTLSEEYYSVSYKNVIRGLHFQIPPMEHVKLVTCVDGNVIDVVVDLRTDSPTYGQYAQFELSSNNKNSVYIPKGLAHGFCVQSDRALILCRTSTVFSPEHDAGINWSSFGFNWPTSNPILSERDQNLTTLEDFKSPFKL